MLTLNEMMLPQVVFLHWSNKPTQYIYGCWLIDHLVPTKSFVEILFTAIKLNSHILHFWAVIGNKEAAQSKH